MLGMGPFPYEGEEDPDLINAGKQTITELPMSSYFSSSDSFGMIRGGHINLSVLGALEVAGNGDLANWMVPGKMVKGMGGAMDLVASAKHIIVAMQHCSKDGASKLLRDCTLPLTGLRCVKKIVTDMAVLDIRMEGMNGVELLGRAPARARQRLEDLDVPARHHGCGEASFELVPDAAAVEVIAERMIAWFFVSNHDGRGAAIAVVLFVAVIPVMIWNVRRFREQEAAR